MISYNFQIINEKIVITIFDQLIDRSFFYTASIENPGNLPNTLDKEWLQNIKGNNFIEELENNISIQISILTPTDK